MDFDRAVGRAGAGIGIWIHIQKSQSSKIPPNVRCFSYKIDFNCSNNEVEYESLIVSLKTLKKLWA